MTPSLLLSSSAVLLTLLVSSTMKTTGAREQQHRRHLSYEKIIGYFPETQVTDHAALDLDQQLFEASLAIGGDTGFSRARSVYADGVHSKSFALLSVDTPLAQALNKGDLVEGKNTDGLDVLGKFLEDAPEGSTFVKVQYQTSDNQENYVGCQVGALGQDNTLFASTANVAGCFAEKGTLFVTALAGEAAGATSTIDIPYTYSIQFNNDNGRTLEKFSTEAQDKMYDCQETGGCPYVDYTKFFDYYGKNGDYAHQWVEAALTKTSLRMGSFEADFSNIGDEGRAEAAKKGTAYMSVWMYVIREFEDALDDCVEGRITDNDDPVHAWDEGVAFYAGSLEGPAGSDDGVMPYRLAEKRCQNFKTCGEKGDELTGTSYVNIELLRLFDQGQNDIFTGQCGEARKKKERIVELMTVPLIQGTLRYAYRSAELPTLDTEKGRAEGSTFAAAVLPIVAKCSARDAERIYEEMKVGGGGATEYDNVKYAFERNYKCMGITCSLVGGLWDDGEQRYYDDAHPCKDSGDSNKLAIGLGIGLGGALLIAVVCLFFVCKRRSSATATDHPMPSFGDTAADFSAGEDGKDKIIA